MGDKDKPVTDDKPLAPGILAAIERHGMPQNLEDTLKILDELNNDQAKPQPRLRVIEGGKR